MNKAWIDLEPSGDDYPLAWVIWDWADERIAKLEEELETYRERHRDTKSNYATMQRLREENNKLKADLVGMEVSYEDERARCYAFEIENNKLKTELDKIAVWAYINTLEGRYWRGNDA